MNVSTKVQYKNEEVDLDLDKKKMVKKDSDQKKANVIIYKTRLLTGFLAPWCVFSYSFFCIYIYMMFLLFIIKDRETD